MRSNIEACLFCGHHFPILLQNQSGVNAHLAGIVFTLRLLIMESNFDLLSGTRSQISVLELKRLLIVIKEYRPDICVRYRLLGEMWSPNFVKVLMVMDRGILFTDETSNRLISLSDLGMVMQFELDNRFREFQPHFHYEVIPSPEFNR